MKSGAIVGRIEILFLFVFTVVGNVPESSHDLDVMFFVKVHDFEVGLHVFAIPVIGADRQVVAFVVLVEPVADDGKPYKRRPYGKDPFGGGFPQIVVPRLECIAVALAGKSPLVVSESFPRGRQFLGDDRFECMQICRSHPCGKGKDNKDQFLFHTMNVL